MSPGRSLFLGLWLWVAVGVLAAVWGRLLDGWLLLGGVVMLVAGTDWLLARRQPTHMVTRHVAHSLALGVWSDVELRLQEPSRAARAVSVHDHYPQSVDVLGMPATCRVPAHGWVAISYRIKPTSRGEYRFGKVQVMVASPLGFWRVDKKLGEETCVKVYPNFAAVSHYALLAMDNRLSVLGVRMHRRRGEGLEFHQLRDYRTGDLLRQIDWKATSRMKKLISREYQDESNQQVVFLLDCGRRMHAKDDELSHFDHALNALLLLAYVALSQGDSVGVMAFGGCSCYLPPRGGKHTMNAILDGVYDLDAGMDTPDYVRAATQFLSRINKRSLVVLITNLRDEDSTELLPALHLLRQRHLVLLASLRENSFRETLGKPIAGFDDAILNSATQLYLTERANAHNAVMASGVLCLDVEPSGLPLALVNRYLAVKRRRNL